MKKLLFAFPIVAFLAAGCSSSQQALNQTAVPSTVSQNSPIQQSTAINNNSANKAPVEGAIKYKNASLNYSLSYPQGWTYEEAPYNQYTGDQTVLFKLAGQIVFEVDNDPNPKQYGTLDAYANYFTIPGANWKDVTINGNAAKQATLSNGEIFTMFMRNSDKEVFKLHLLIYQSSQQAAYSSALNSFKF